MKKEGVLAKLVRRIFGSAMTDRRDTRKEHQVAIFKDEFMIEIPLDVDVSAITGVKGVSEFKLARVQDFDDRQELGDV